MNLKHLSQSGTFPSGNPRYYMGPKGTKRIAMPDLREDDPRFVAAWVRAAEAHGLADSKPRRLVVAGSLASEIELYKASDHFKVLAAGVQSRRRPVLDEITEKYGHGRIKDLRSEHVEKDLSAFSGHPRNNRRRVWRGLGMWLKDAKRLPHDPTLDVDRAKTAKSEGHEPWSDEDVATFRASWPHGTLERLAFELLYWTGARVSDGIRLGEGNVDRDSWLTFRQAKTGGEVFIPFRRELPEFADCYAADLEMLHMAIDARTERHLTFLSTRQGASRSPKSISQWFAAKARVAGLIGRTAHGLRKSRAIALVEAGAGSPQIGAWTGHESLREIERYIREFNRRKALTRTKMEHKVPTPATQFQQTNQKVATSNG